MLLASGGVAINTTTPNGYKLNVNGSSIFKFIDIGNPDGRVTHFPFGSSGQNYIRGIVNIDQDDLRFGNRVQFFINIFIW